MFQRYRQILDKAIQFTDVDQLESLKAFVEASMYAMSLWICVFNILNLAQNMMGILFCFVFFYSGQ